MQLFYHGTRDIELPTAGRRLDPAAAARHCEACGRTLADSDASEGSANGLAFCADCRRRVDRSAIQIHFCDACGVSVPLEDVEEGNALAPDGRILCAACRAPRRADRRLPAWALVAAAAAVVLGAALAWIS